MKVYKSKAFSYKIRTRVYASRTYKYNVSRATVTGNISGQGKFATALGTISGNGTLFNATT